MKSFEEAVENLKSGFVITIKKNQLVYDGYMLKYDGNIFKDISLIDLGSVLDQFSNIKSQLDYGYSYYGIYDFEQKNYQSTIINSNKREKIRTLIDNEILNDFQTFDQDFMNSMIELDSKIASQNFVINKKIHQKKLVS